MVAGGTLTAANVSQGPGPEWLNLTGKEWRQMEPDARQAYIEGFLAGAALSQAAEGARDTAAVSAQLENLRRTNGFRFPFGANVYVSRMSDYYWWTNHLPLPTWYALMEVNTTLGRRISDSMP